MKLGCFLASLAGFGFVKSPPISRTIVSLVTFLAGIGELPLKGSHLRNPLSQILGHSSYRLRGKPKTATE
jgi:hypothetical protein